MSLAQTVSDRLRAGALVLVVQEADELLALASVEAGAGACQPIVVISGADPDAASKLENLPSGVGTLVLLDYLAIYGDNPLTVRMVREVALQQRDEGQRFSRLVLIEQPATKIPAGLIGDAEVIQAALPSVAELTDELDAFIETQGITIEGNGENRYALASAVAGLPRNEAARLYARATIENPDGLAPAWLRAEKAKRVAARLGGALTFEATGDTPDVGGLENLRDWLAQRGRAFGSAKARAFGLPEPKGLLLLGVPGSGKSLVAKTIARQWGLPLLKLDAGRLFGSLVGQSEQQTRQATEAAEACAPCVLWVDEIEKGLAGASGGGGDGGTTQRVFGALLTWLQEKKAPVFVVATANKIEALPPELLRKGRFDEIFFVGLPNVDERRAIAKIHLERRGREGINHKVVAEATEGFSGAEIEQAVVEGLFTAYAAGRDLELADVVGAARATSPLSRTMGEDIKRLESWADGRARAASKVDVTEATNIKRRVRRPGIK